MSISLGENTEITLKLGALVVLICAAISVAIWVQRVEAHDRIHDEQDKVLAARMDALEKRWDEKDKKLEEQNAKVLSQTTLILKQIGVLHQ